MPPSPHPLESDEDRRARHLSALKDLTTLGMNLARKAATRAEAHLDAPDTDPADPRPADHARTFERYARIVRTLIGLEHRIAALDPARRTFRPGLPSAAVRFGPDADPRRPKLRRFIQEITRSNPDAAEIRRLAQTTIDATLDRDPDRAMPIGQILDEICTLYGLPFDIAQLPDAFLVPYPSDPPLDPEPDPAPETAPEPATDPPTDPP